MRKPQQKSPLNLAELFQQALNYHQQGNLAQADALYRQVLAQNPRHADALHFLGVLAYQAGQPEAAVELINKAITVNSNSAPVYCNLGLALQATGKLDAAIDSYQKALALQPDFANAKTNLQLALQHKAHLSMAQNRIPEAIACYQQLLPLNPQDANIYYSLAVLFYGQNDLAHALENFQKAILYKPDYAEAYYSSAVIFAEQGNFDSAVACYRNAIAFKPDYIEAYNNLGLLLQEQGNLSAAVETFQQALSVMPNNAEFHYHLGGLFFLEKEWDKSFYHCQQTISLNPDNADAYFSLGTLLYSQNDLESALEAYQKATALNPNLFKAHRNMGGVLLALGRFEEGWLHHEARYHPQLEDPDVVPPDLSFPQWQGESIKGKSLLIYPEQGLGDQIQFCRYVSVLKERGAGFITLVCKKSLKPLFETLKGVDQVITDRQISTVQLHDYWTFVISLPFHCQTTLETVPAKVPYFYPSVQKIEQFSLQLKQLHTLKIGICWQGNPKFVNDAERSPGISWFSPLFKLTGISFFSLQPNTRIELLSNAQEKAFDIGRELDENSFEDAAALMMNLDLIITSCTSVCHLAGALGKPVWVVLPFKADWRWMLEREDSPWYPTMRLFRQKERGNWQEVFERVEKRLQKITAGELPIT